MQAHSWSLMSTVAEPLQPQEKFTNRPCSVAYIWSGVLGSNPGYKAFGYTSTGACDAMCDDPEHYFCWIPGYVNSKLCLVLGD
jgi:hypothetical protein